MTTITNKRKTDAKEIDYIEDTKFDFKFTKPKIGCDPEFFIVDKLGKPVSAIGLVGGSKQSPRAILTEAGFAVQEDNVAVEINIPPEDLAWNFSRNVERAIEFIGRELKEKELGIAYEATFEFDPLSLEHPQAKEFGCEPDYNAWTKEKNPRPDAKINPLLRSAGGHIHLSWESFSAAQSFWLIRALDLFIGVPSVLMDGNVLRRSLYGKAGAFRNTSYGELSHGVEYRTPSNFWTKTSELRMWIADSAFKAMKFLEEEKTAQDVLKIYKDDIINCIDNSDKELAKKLMLDCKNAY